MASDKDLESLVSLLASSECHHLALGSFAQLGIEVEAGDTIWVKPPWGSCCSSQETAPGTGPWAAPWTLGVQGAQRTGQAVQVHGQCSHGAGVRPVLSVLCPRHRGWPLAQRPAQERWRRSASPAQAGATRKSSSSSGVLCRLEGVAAELGDSAAPESVMGETCVRAAALGGKLSGESGPPCSAPLAAAQALEVPGGGHSFSPGSQEGPEAPSGG